MSFNVESEDIFDAIQAGTEFDYDEAFHDLCDTFPFDQGLAGMNCYPNTESRIPTTYNMNTVSSDMNDQSYSQNSQYIPMSIPRPAPIVIPTASQIPFGGQPLQYSPYSGYPETSSIPYSQMPMQQKASPLSQSPPVCPQSQNWFENSGISEQKWNSSISQLQNLKLNPAAKQRVELALQKLRASKPEIVKAAASKPCNKSKIAPLLKVVTPMKDPRRQYPKQFFETLNLCDQQHLIQFLSEKCTKDISMTFKYVGKKSPYGGNYLELIGSHAVEMLYTAKFASIPDGVYQIANNSLATQFIPGGGCSISCLFNFSGTKTITLISDIQSLAIVANPITGVIKAHQIEGENRVIIREIPNLKMIEKICDKPLEVDVSCKATFCINKANKIYKVEVVHCEKKKKKSSPTTPTDSVTVPASTSDTTSDVVMGTADTSSEDASTATDSTSLTTIDNNV